MNTREEERVVRLRVARDKLVSRREAMSMIERNTGRGKRFKEKLKEYDESLKNLSLYGVEHVPDGQPIGVNIGVPHAGDKT